MELARVVGTNLFQLGEGHWRKAGKTPDDTTIIFNIRQGVHWHDKAPMNGRELTAKDVEYNWQRLLGLGKFSEAGASLMAGGFPPEDFESVTATDDWTVRFQAEQAKLPRPEEPSRPMDCGDIPSGGDRGTRRLQGLAETRSAPGPYALTEVVEESSRTWTKNPNYWGYDPKYPDNRLPYTDKVVALLMPEGANSPGGSARRSA